MQIDTSLPRVEEVVGENGNEASKDEQKPADDLEQDAQDYLSLSL